MVLRDAKREVVMATSKIENEVNGPSEMELLAVFRGLQMCVQMDIPKLIVEVIHY